MSMPHIDYCIVGAGPSGLTAAYKLLQGRQKVLVIERDNRIGGLAKSYNYHGHIFDTGPKRFHTDDPIVTNFIKEVTDNKILHISRSTKVYFLKQFFEWPLHTRDVLKMPAGISIKCFLDLIKERKINDKTSFHEFINSKYGETLYATFFHPYTKKFLRWDPEDIHADWASTGINRTVIDKRIKTNTLLDIFKGLMLPQKVDTEFLYPHEGGFGSFYERILNKCQQYDGFQLMLNDAIRGLEVHGNKFSAITKETKSISFDQLIWTGNLNDLCRIIFTDNTMHYLNTIFYNIICKEEGIGNKKAQWIYVSKGDSLISRITCMKEFAPYTCKSGYYNLICELTDSQWKPVYFKSPQRYIDQILNELIEMSFLKNKTCVEDVIVNPIVDTYPIYHKRYIKDFASAKKSVKKFSPRIHLLGRCGAFWYNNSDHSIRFALELSEKLLGKNDTDFNYRNYFGGTTDRASHPHGT